MSADSDALAERPGRRTHACACSGSRTSNLACWLPAARASRDGAGQAPSGPRLTRASPLRCLSPGTQGRAWRTRPGLSCNGMLAEGAMSRHSYPVTHIPSLIRGSLKPSHPAALRPVPLGRGLGRGVLVVRSRTRSQTRRGRAGWRGSRPWRPGPSTSRTCPGPGERPSRGCSFVTEPDTCTGNKSSETETCTENKG